MREIKFRGLDVLTGNWVYGNLLTTPAGMYIIPQALGVNFIQSYQVDKDTVGQYTGVNDFDGKEIYEGDIDTQDFYDGRPLETGAFTGVVEFFEGAWWISNRKNHAESLWSEINVNKVIGNIHENPDLLEVSS